MKTRFLGLVLALALGSLSFGGCASRRIKAFDDHQKHALSTLETFQTTNYWLWIDQEYQFYMCRDTGDQLVCRRECSGTNDVKCPQGAFVGLAGGTNVR